MTNPSTFNGVGFFNGPIQSAVPFLTQTTTPQQFLYDTLLSEVQKVAPSTTNLDAFFNTFSVDNVLPQNITDFSTAFDNFYNLGSVGVTATNITNDIVNSNEAAISTNPNSFGNFGPQDSQQTPLITPIGSQIVQQSTFNQDMATRSFNNFLSTFQYSGTSPVNSTEFQTQWGNYYVNVASVSSSYLSVFTAFFDNSSNPMEPQPLRMRSAPLSQTLCIRKAEAPTPSFRDTISAAGSRKSSSSTRRPSLVQADLSKLPLTLLYKALSF